MRAITTTRTFANEPFRIEEGPEVKRGGGGGKGGIALHRTMGDMNTRPRHPAPPGYGQTQYRRRFFNNVAALLGFIMPTNFDQTRNDVDGGLSGPKSPVPWSRRWYAPTYRPNWNPRLWQLYIPNEAIDIQRGVNPRVVNQQAQMGKPYPNLLTFYRRYPPYSNQTKVLSRG